MKKIRPIFRRTTTMQLAKYYSRSPSSNQIVLGTTRAFGKGELAGKIKFDNKRRVILVSGPQGSGKSINAMRIVSEYIHKFEVPWLIIDPQHEFLSHKQPLQDKYAEPLYLHNAEIVGRSKGIGEVIVLTPYSLQEAVDEVGFVSSIHLRDFFKLKDRQLMKNLLMELLEIKGSGFVAARRQFSVVIEQVLKKPNDKWSFKELFYAVKNYARRSRETEGKKASYVIEEKLDSLIRGQIVEVEGTVDCDVSGFLAQGKSVVLQTSLSGTDVTDYDIQISLMVLSIVQNSHLFSRGVGVFADEFENIAPRERKKSELKDLIVKIPTKYRKKKIYMVGVTQIPESVHPAFVSQSDVLVFANMTVAQLKYLVENSRMSPSISRVALNLKSGEPPALEWLVVFPFRSKLNFEGQLETVFDVFFPLPSRGQFNVVAS